MKTKFMILPWLIFAAGGVYAQSVGPATINSAGGSTAISTNTYEWSVGEMTVVGTFSSGNLVVTQGVLQPTISTSGVKDTYLADNMKVYPTPTENIVYLQPSFSTGGQLQYLLRDITGKMLKQYEAKLVSGSEKQSIDMSAYAAGNYLLTVIFTQGDKTYSVPYKIQKN